MALLEVNDLTTYYKLKEGHVRACEGVSLRVEKGEALGLVGESASGKTTVALSLIKLLPENASVSEALNLTARNLLRRPKKRCRNSLERDSIIFQGAMNALNPVRTVGDQIAGSENSRKTDRQGSLGAHQGPL